MEHLIRIKFPSFFPDLRPEMLMARQHPPGPMPPGRTKDDAYQQFMREMEGLL